MFNFNSKDDDSYEDELDEEDEEEVYEDAEDLFNLVHDRMSNDMKVDEFIDVAGDIGDDLTFIELKQLYNNAANKDEDPSRSVRIDDYVEVLAKMKKGE